MWIPLCEHFSEHPRPLGEFHGFVKNNAFYEGLFTQHKTENIHSFFTNITSVTMF